MRAAIGEEALDYGTTAPAIFAAVEKAGLEQGWLQPEAA
jgi:hypothetical protein